MHAWGKLALEAGPLAIFFIMNSRFGIFPATQAFIIASLAALAILWWRERRLALMPLLSAVVVLLFGGLTLWLEDALFIKLKPTIVNLLCAGALLGGQLFGRNLLKPVFGAHFKLTERGWQILSRRWGGFFLLLAALNEIVWRTQSTDMWVNFKVFAILPLTIIFSLCQMPILLRYQLRQSDNDPKGHAQS
jgi:intracellular septation protein